jgi:hypothetical protein
MASLPIEVFMPTSVKVRASMCRRECVLGYQDGVKMAIYRASALFIGFLGAALRGMGEMPMACANAVC